jgi:hypothetical protein
MHLLLYNILWLRRHLSLGVAAMAIEVAETVSWLPGVCPQSHTRTRFSLGRERERELNWRCS